MTDRVALVAANIALVQQGITVLDAIDDRAFVRTAPPIYHSGVGPHLRHCIDHYRCFLGGWRDGAIDYDARGRQAALETDRAAARDALDDVRRALLALTTADVGCPVFVAYEWDPVDSADTPAIAADAAVGLPTAEAIRGRCASDVGRELLFLASHTVHHYALIALILRHQAIDVPRGFGVAPSTLSHRRHHHAPGLVATPS
ncbi:MAG: hypothetical protein ABI780_09125 [Ardenticatenales bacterium]